MSRRSKGQTLSEEKSDTSPIPEHLLEQFLGNQKLDLELKAKSFELDREANTQSFEYAKDALQFQSEHLKEERAHQAKMARYWLGIVALGLIILSSIIAYALFLEQSDIAKTLIHTVALVITGGGGFALGRKTKGTHENNDPTDEN